MDEKNREVEYRQWGVSPSKAVFLLVHGLGAHAGRWESAGDFFAKHGITSYAIELKNFDLPKCGHGNIIRLREIAMKEHPGKPIFLVGESFGAIISIEASSRGPGLFSGLICIAPAFANRVRPAVVEQLKIAASLLYNPNKQFRLPFSSEMCTRDTEYIKKMDEDSGEYRTVSSRLILNILLAQLRAGKLKDRIKEPVLFLVAGDDRLVDSAVTKKVFNAMTVEDKTLVEFPGMYHSLTIELGKETVFEEILKWVKERM